MRSSAFVLAVLMGLACPSLTVGATQTTVFPGADWQESTPEAQGVDSAKLKAAVDYLKANAPYDGVNELVVIRNGYLIWKGTNIDRRHGIWSCTKSFTSTVLGLLIEDGKCTLDTKVKSCLSSMSAIYPDVTLRHFTTMTSGYFAEGDNYTTHGQSGTPFTPSSTPLFTPPGSKYAYWDSAMNQFANTLTRIAGEPIEQFFKRRIADPIGMKATDWDWGDWGNIDGLVVNGGAGNNGRDIKITARQMARLGHLFLNRGSWNGKQLISSAWVDAAKKPQVPSSMPLGHPQASPIDGPGVYGYNWWVNGIKSDGTRKWPDAPASTFSASGYNNNDMFVIPDWNMLIVRLGLDQQGTGGFAITDATYSTFLKMVGQALATSPTPSAPSGLTATTVSSSQINLSWTDNSSNEDGFKIERKTGSTGTWAQIATVGAGVTGYQNTGLSASTTYYYRVRAYNAAGDSAYSNEASATTLAGSAGQAVTGFTLINADTDTEIGPLNDGMVLDLALLPTRNLNVRANTSPVTVGSVRFAYDGSSNYRTENVAPYALAGDAGGDFYPWTPSNGPHSLTATPWSGSGATGTAGASMTISFTILGGPLMEASLVQIGEEEEIPFEDDDTGGHGRHRCGALGIEILPLIVLLRLRRWR